MQNLGNNYELFCLCVVCVCFSADPRTLCIQRSSSPAIEDVRVGHRSPFCFQVWLGEAHKSTDRAVMETNNTGTT